MKRLSMLWMVLWTLVLTAGAYQPETSVAGFFPLENSGREIYSFNAGWRYYMGDDPEAKAFAFDDSSWEIVSLPHTLSLLPAEGSGCRNYQGKVWYRKHFVVASELKDKQVQLYFEAVMGKATVYLNGDSVLQHFGGYLPFSLNLNDYGVEAGDTCVISLCADNSNDKSYPPGKPQYTLDFAYHGGIYRDVWMIAKSPLYITDAVTERHEVAGGGVFVHFGEISDNKAQVYVDTEIGNKTSSNQSFVLETTLCDAKGNVLKKAQQSITLKAGAFRQVKQSFVLNDPQLWSPENPYLYKVRSCVKQGRSSLDGGITRIGIRQAEFKGKDGFWLNGKPYHQLLGSNRHQDFAYVGNALPNSQHWRDVKLLREAGCTIIRSAHYPQDPAFMDACDELGIFMIVPTPGWQYWNKAPRFAEYVLDDVTQMIRRDRNHTSVLLWEPILNETRFPLDFSMKALQITKDEFPYPNAPLAVADMNSEGVAEHYGLVYGWPKDSGMVEQCIFTREFGENVDDWYAQNNNNRASRSFGEGPLLVQAMSLAKSYDEMFQTNGQFVGGAQWHSFDHQRGYHPDPYWGGIADAFRQPKYAFYMFKSQVPADEKHSLIETGPMIYFAHEMSAYSPADVTLFTNCDSVRLICRETDTIVMPVLHREKGMPNAPVVFKNVFDFWQMRELSYLQKNWQQVSFVAEGIINGKVVCTCKKMPSRRSNKLQLRVDHAGQSLLADGSDFLVVIAEMTDDNGNVRRLAKDNVFFSIEGEGEIIGDAAIGANPRALEFGSAPILVRSTTTPGKIKVTARLMYEGQNTAKPVSLEFESIPANFRSCALEQNVSKEKHVRNSSASSSDKMSEAEMKRLIDEVVQQQMDFGEKK